MTWPTNKSGFPKKPVPKGAKKRPQVYIDPEAFILMRHRAFLTTYKAAEALHVTHRTLLNWERGKSRIPYTAYRILKMLTGYVFNDEYFKDWFVKGDTFWSPENRGFKPHELRYISHYFAMARLWIAERQQLKTKTSQDLAIADGATSNDSPAIVHRPANAGSVADNLLSLCGVASPHEAGSVPEASISQQRPPDFEKFLEMLGITA